jgi:hypothetical protein
MNMMMMMMMMMTTKWSAEQIGLKHSSTNIHENLMSGS